MELTPAENHFFYLGHSESAASESNGKSQRGEHQYGDDQDDKIENFKFVGASAANRNGFHLVLPSRDHAPRSCPQRMSYLAFQSTAGPEFSPLGE